MLSGHNFLCKNQLVVASPDLRSALEGVNDSEIKSMRQLRQPTILHVQDEMRSFTVLYVKFAIKRGQHHCE